MQCLADRGSLSTPVAAVEACRSCVHRVLFALAEVTVSSSGGPPKTRLGQVGRNYDTHPYTSSCMRRNFYVMVVCSSTKRPRTVAA